MIKIALLIFVSATVVSLTACGNKGPLLPPQPASVEPTQTQTLAPVTHAAQRAFALPNNP